MSQTDLDALTAKLTAFVDADGETPTQEELRSFQKLVIQQSKIATADQSVDTVHVDEEDSVEDIQAKINKASRKRVMLRKSTKPLQDLLANAIGKLSA